MINHQPKDIIKVIQEFNKYHGLEIRAEILSLKNNILIIQFTGSFCDSCGLADYFEDFQIFLDDTAKIRAEIEYYEKIDTGTYQVHYRLL